MTNPIDKLAPEPESSQSGIQNPIRQRANIISALVVLLSVCLLYALPIERFTTLSIYLIVIVLGSIIAGYRTQKVLFTRRAFIEKAFLEHSKIRNWLWRGTLLKVWCWISSFVIALAIIVAADSLTAPLWVLLIVMSLCVVAVMLFTAKPLKKHTHKEFLSLASFSLSALPLTLIVVSVAGLLYFYSPQVKLQSNDLGLSIEASFFSTFEHYDSDLLGLANGLVASLDTVTMYVAQNFIPRLNESFMQWFLWCYLAVKSAVPVLLIMYLMQAISWNSQRIAELGLPASLKQTFDSGFTVTIVSLAVIFLFLLTLGAPRPKLPISQAPTCKMINAELGREFLARNEALASQEDILKQRSSERAVVLVDATFADLDTLVERYLDWEFSVLGEYQRLIFTTGEAKFQEIVLGPLDTQFSDFQNLEEQRISDFISTNETIIATQQTANLFSSECSLPINLGLPLIADAAPVGAVQTAVVTGKLGAKVVSKVGMKFAAKGAGKVAASLAGFSAGAVCGPLAWACSPILGTVTWFGFDKAVVEVDEARNRVKRKAELISPIEEQKSLILASMTQYYEGYITSSFDQLEFHVSRDGF